VVGLIIAGVVVNDLTGGPEEGTRV
jgi:hypothetical protein